MNLKNANWLVFLSAALLTLLFYKQGIGLNLLIFESLFILYLVLSNQLNYKNTLVLWTLVGFSATSIFTITSYSIFSYVIHFFTLLIFIGVINFPKINSLTSALFNACAAIFMSQVAFLSKASRIKYKGHSLGKWLWGLRMFLVPIFIIALFIILYSGANNAFGKLVQGISNQFSHATTYLFYNVNSSLVFTYLFCLFLSIILIVRYKNTIVELYDQTSPLTLFRKRINSKMSFGKIALKNEYKAGVFLFSTLNLILLLVNYLDIKNVWLGFQWDGDTLKEFVHEGTYLLILSILISIAIVLYYFRRNLNFYSKNSWLKTLSYIWIIQNAVLVISVGIRNLKYIEYYALAYKRIGVLLFLIATLYGLFTVYIKVTETKSAFYLFKKNSFSLYLILVFSSALPWDSVITKYNFEHAESSYVHLEYLADFSHKALPYLDQPIEFITSIKNNQNPNFVSYQDLSALEYVNRIQQKKQHFKLKWEAKSWLSWNLAEARAYKKLFSKIE